MEAWWDEVQGAGEHKQEICSSIQSTGLTPIVVPSVVLRARGAMGVLQGQQFVKLNVATYTY